MADSLSAGFSIDITQLKAGLTQANRLIRESQSAYRAAAAEIEAAGDKTEGYEKAINALNSTIDVQRKRVSALETEYARLESEGLDPASSEMIKLRTDINKANAELSKSISQLNKTEGAFDSYKKAAQDAADGVEDVADAAGDAGDAADDAADGIGVFDIALGNVVANGISAFVGGVKDAIGALLGLADETKEYRTELAKMDAAADVAGASADYIKDKWHDLGAVLGDEGAVGEGLNNLMAAGFTTEEEMDAITKHLEGAAIKWKDTLKFEGLADGLQETLATGAAVGSFGEMLERSGVNLDTFDEGLAKCTTDAEKQNYVLDQLSKLGLAEVSEAYRTQNADLIASNKAQSDYTDAQAEAGERMQGISTAIKKGVTDVLNAFLELTEGVDFDAIASGVSGAFSWFIETGLPAIMNGLGWIKDNIPTITTVAAGLTAAIVAQTAATKIKTITDLAAAKGMTVMEMAQKALNAAMKANMIGLIITAITALVAAFIYLWNNCESFRNFWIGLWNGIKTAAGAAMDWLKSAFSALGTFFTETWAKFKDAGARAWSAIKTIFGNVAGFFKEKFGQAWAAVKAIFSTGGAIFSGIVEGISAAFKNIVNAIIRGINKVVSIPFNAINTALDKLRSVDILGNKPFSFLPTISVPEIPELAKGGIVRSATNAIIGEAGKEAVLPLERNTGWMDMLAERLAEKGGGVTVNQTNHFAQAHTRYEMYQSRKQLAAAVRLART